MVSFDFGATTPRGLIVRSWWQKACINQPKSHL